jgi:hypothetical protein
MENRFVRKFELFLIISNINIYFILKMLKKLLIFINLLIFLSAKYNYNRILNKNYKSDIEFHFQPEFEYYKNQTVK